MSNNERQKLLNKIRALMAKTVENGCTEAEALAALNMAQAMMDAYEVTDEDIKLEDEAAIIGQTNMRDPYKIQRLMATAIGLFVNCRVWQSDKNQIKFCGLKSDVEFGVWLLETLARFVRTELDWHLCGCQINHENKRWHANGFIIGCTNRIRIRLVELMSASKIKASNNANALVIAKNELIEKTLEKAGILLEDTRSRRSRINPDSHAAGQAAGNKASFGRPLSGAGSQLKLGYK